MKTVLYLCTIVSLLHVTGMSLLVPFISLPIALVIFMPLVAFHSTFVIFAIAVYGDRWNWISGNFDKGKEEQ